MSELIAATAREVVAGLRAREFGPAELLKALEERAAQVEPVVNAIPERFFDLAHRAAEGIGAEGDPARWLAGLPLVVKDYNDVAGVPTSMGSPIFAGTPAPESDAMVRRLEANGAVPFAKSNVPEFAGGHTYNPVFGATRNPWDPRLTAGGSSGGSAAAVAAGLGWLATGNDLGGSLRTPAGYCGVVGIRPTPGRIPRRSPKVPFDGLWVEGPMARDVRDAALMLDAMVGWDPHDPLTSPDLPGSFLSAMSGYGPPRRVAFSPDLGLLPVEPVIRERTERAMAAFEHLGATVEHACPDFTGAYDTFQTLRAELVAASHGPLLGEHRDRIKPDIVWNIERGLRQGTDAVLRAQRRRGELFHEVVRFYDDYDVLVCPTAPVMPFPVERHWPTEIAGTPLDTYIDWIAITFFVSLTACPVVALPCGLHEGLPVGVQLVGPPGSEARLLAYAAELEAAAGVAGRLPVTPRKHG
ncbi:amidase [Prauserella flavalba]|uniref:amidase n=1 Tax=Prauserella flavalba TaxID=1477506 RepID=UPI0036EE36B0